MFFRFKEYDFEDAFYFILYCIIIVSFICSLCFLFAPKRVIAYELGTIEKGLTMNVNVENGADYTIQLIGVDYDKAIELVEKANKSIAK